MSRLVRLIVTAAIACAMPDGPEARAAPVHVRGYTRKDGTYVRSHTRSEPRTAYRGWASVSVASHVGPVQPVVSPRTPVGGPGDPRKPVPDDEAPGRQREVPPGRSVTHRTAYRTSVRGLDRPRQPEKRFPIREWRSVTGDVLARGRMEWRAMNRLRIRGADGTPKDLSVADLSQDDLDWLEAVRRDPQAFKTDAVPAERIESEISDVPGNLDPH